MLVVDASVLVDFLLGRPTTLAALENEMREREHEPLHAPDLIELEALSALRRLTRSEAISGERAGQAVADLDRVRLTRYPHPPLRERVWALSDELTPYDAGYLALAEGLGGRLLTADAGLAARARAAIGAARVLHID